MWMKKKRAGAGNNDPLRQFSLKTVGNDMKMYSENVFGNRVIQIRGIGKIEPQSKGRVILVSAAENIDLKELIAKPNDH